MFPEADSEYIGEGIVDPYHKKGEEYGFGIPISMEVSGEIKEQGEGKGYVKDSEQSHGDIL